MTKNRPTPWSAFADKNSDTIAVLDANRKEAIPWPGFDLRGILPWKERIEIAKLCAAAPDTARQRDELADALEAALEALKRHIPEAHGVHPNPEYEVVEAARTALKNAGREG